MNAQQRLLTSILKRIPAHYRQIAKKLVERYSDSAQRSFYGDYGEDAFLQSYFRYKAYQAYPGLPLYMYQKAVTPGFYVDIGAYSPKLFSTTYWFYRHGWHGINVDATPGSMDIFCKVRPRDINLEMAISNQEGHLTFYCFGQPSPLNTLCPDRAAQLAKELDRNPVEMRVPAMKLSSVLDTYLSPNQDISFLSVDVEKHDLEVLESNNWEKYRPELVLVENHTSRITEVIESEITCFLSKMGYSMYAWIKPTIVYRLADLPDPLVV